MSSIKSQSSFGDSNSSLTDPESRSSKVFISKRMPHLGSNFSFESSQSVLYNISEPGIVAAVPSYEYYGYVVYLVSFGFFDNYSQLDIKKSLGDFDVKQLGGIPEITDLPIEVVNYCLYS
ncbi:hypothetical protein BB559_004891 [Furculomyces boomerangus]|uniref:Uncharacterized protein n=1 Tax=Furculomyces boomerangus TaxID=61424 RepID=A0A2T9Y692_9FUNG|nr:hypothetical protein BB559_005858 [Furculomyces boomerangus]PVU89872.1 hypothetical protein BB559_004891 [Furculomyces boomerangus]